MRCLSEFPLSRRAVLTALAVLAAGAPATTPLALAKAPKPEVAHATYDCDVVVVGSGAAGLASAVAAAEKGARVIVLEKMPVLGGSSVLALDYFTAVGPRAEALVGHTLSADKLEAGIMKSGGQLNDPALTHFISHHAGDAFEWLTSLGAALTNPVPIMGSNDWAGFRPQGRGSVGNEIVKALLRRAEVLRIPIETLARVDRLHLTNGRISGVRVTGADSRSWIIRANAVVLATGSFASNPELVSKYAHAAYLSTTAPGNTGDGLVMAMAAGAAVKDLDLLEYHPTSLPATGEVITGTVRINGAILVNTEGKRFINELKKRNYVGDAIEKQPGSMAWLIVDDDVLAREERLARSTTMESAVSANSVEGLAIALGISPETLEATLREYRKNAVNGTDPFGRDDAASLLTGPRYWAWPVRKALLSTSGGIVTATSGQVVKPDGAPVPGLYAAGDVMAGLNGLERLSGMGLVNAVVMGREAGENAAKYAHDVKTDSPCRRPSSDRREPVFMACPAGD